MKEEMFIEIISKKLSGEINSEEEILLSNWLLDSEANQKIFLEYQKIWELADVKNEFEPDVDLAFKKFAEKIDQKQTESKEIPLNPSSKRSNWWVGIAASLLFLIGISVFIRMQISDTKTTLVAKVDTENNFTLPDGSKIWLNKSSKIIYPSKFRNREIKLSGEAFFNVAKDASRPFVIQCESAVIKVLGTSFNVRTDQFEDEVEVTVKTGKVEVNSTVSKQKIYVVPNEKAIVNLKNGTVTKLENDEPNVIAWKEKQLTFENERLEVIALELSHYFGITFTINENIKNCRFTSDFNNPKLEEILALFGNYYNIHKSNDGKQILISGATCD